VQEAEAQAVPQGHHHLPHLRALGLQLLPLISHAESVYQKTRLLRKLRSD
jgi:hypothetical protein